jgi:hypothetical protein
LWNFVSRITRPSVVMSSLWSASASEILSPVVITHIPESSKTADGPVYL